jgi:hypothetical protein
MTFQTPLHFAAGNGYGEIVKILLQNGAWIDEQKAFVFTNSFG